MRQFGLGGGGRTTPSTVRPSFRNVAGRVELVVRLVRVTAQSPRCHATAPGTHGGPPPGHGRDRPGRLGTQLAAGDPVAIGVRQGAQRLLHVRREPRPARMRVPFTPGFDFLPTRQPVVLDLGTRSTSPRDRCSRPRQLATAARWFRSTTRSTTGAKHLEFFLRFLDLPKRTGANFELALAGGCEASDRALLARHGWHTRTPFLSADSLED